MGALFNCIGDYLLEKSFASECKQAGLVSTSIQLSFGKVEYLRSVKTSDASPEVIVLLHGAAANKSAWVRFAKYLRSKCPLLIPDLPGHGKSVADVSLDYSIAAQASRLTEMFSALGIDKVHLIGNSMGGAIALHLASTSPHLVSSLVLIDAAGVEVSPSWLRQHMERTGLNPMIDLHDAEGYREMMRIGMEVQPYIPDVVIAALARDCARRRAINWKIVNDIEQDLDQTESLSDIVAPSLIIWGAEDKIFHVDNAEFLHRHLPGSRKLVMEKIGHVPMVEAPKQVAAMCSSFFADIGRNASGVYLKHHAIHVW